LAILAMLVPSLAHATWSIIALDRSTKTIVIASATCVTAAGLASRGGLKSIQAVVLPGIGVGAAQAGVDDTRANQQLIYDEMKKGTPPSDIIALLKADPRIASRQFGIIDMQGRMAGLSGERNGAVSLDVQGQVPGTEIFFSVQGNILKAPEVVTDAVAALKVTKGSLTDRVRRPTSRAATAAAAVTTRVTRLWPRRNAATSTRTWPTSCDPKLLTNRVRSIKMESTRSLSTSPIRTSRRTKTRTLSRPFGCGTTR
jgi:hypothetical protein